MRVTVDHLTQLFKAFNQMYFDDRLPLPRLMLSNSKTCLGSMRCRRRRTLFRTENYDFTIRLTTFYDMDEGEAQNILLHEMIHLYIACNNLTDSAPHGRIFRRLMHELNRKSGRNITVSTSTKNWKRSTPRTRSKKNILALVTCDDKHFLSVVHSKYVQQLNQRLQQQSPIKQYCWFATDDEFFDDFPVVRSLRGRKVSAQLFHEKTQGRCWTKEP